MKIYGFVPARMAASRFPGKPLFKICGRPMIEHVFLSHPKITVHKAGMYKARTERHLHQDFGTEREYKERNGNAVGTECRDTEWRPDQNGPDRTEPECKKSVWPYLDTHGLPEALDWTKKIVSARSSFLAWF